MGWWIAAAAAAAVGDGRCTFLMDGLPVDRLDCAAGGAWVVRCPLPEGPNGKVRLRASFAAQKIVAEARVSSEGDSVQVPLSGPGGRAGRFVVAQPAAGLLPGQAVGPAQWCPVVQPGVDPGGPRAERPLVVTVDVHRQTGFAEEVLDGGVVSRVPIYDAGTVAASGEATVVWREVGSAPAVAPAAGPREEAVKGRLSVAGPDGIWRAFGWTGALSHRPVETGEVEVLVLDFSASEVEAAGGGDPLAWLKADLGRWLVRDPSSLLGHAAWAKSGFEPSGEELPFAWASRAGRQWRIAGDERLEARLIEVDDQIRAVIAWRAAPWDEAVREEVEAAAGSGL